MGGMAEYMPNFLKNYQPVFLSVYIILHTHQQYMSSSFISLSSIFGIVSLFHLRHFNVYAVISPCVLICISLSKDVEYIYIYILAFTLSVYKFSKMAVQSFYSFVYWNICTLINELSKSSHILNLCLLDICFANSFCAF